MSVSGPSERYIFSAAAVVTVSRAPAPTSLSRPKRSPPVIPPPVLTMTASSPAWLLPLGKRTRSEPDSWTRPRRLPPGPAATVNAILPTARLPAKISLRSGALPSIGSPIKNRASNRHGALERALVEIVAVAGIDDGAAVHDGEMVAEFAGKVEILLDQHDGDLAERAQIGDGAADILDDRRLDAFGRLVEQQEPRPHHQGAADGELLLLAARQVAAAPAQHGFEHREQREHVVGRAARVARQRRKPGAQIFLDREQRKDFAALRHIGDAAPRPLRRFQRGDVVAFPGDGAAAHRLLAGQRVEEAGLADAVPAEHAGDLARLGFQRYGAQRLRGAVMQVDGLRVQHDQRPKYTSTTRSFCETWSIEPSASTEPSCRHVTLTPRSRTNVISCSTTTTVCSLLISLSSSAVCRVSTSVMPATGSSTNRSFGSCASSMPISSHCFCPCAKLPARRLRTAVRRVVAKISSMRRCSAGVCRHHKLVSAR